ncbi:hypothetical protein ED733_008625 [Metarhizium rileyi]|uniref:Uncharacterized protein n=1 Tax=Metarhizium rileyi (strain RCEF 4871) TaxID=1649241 RepID=A0A5C6GHV6_METRR|nr:hypothetical protein ED733_008625 [Metarhizium rileyi]
MKPSVPLEKPAQSRETRRGHKYSTSMPANMQSYANRPLPPLPPPSSSAPRAMTPQPRRRSSTMAVESIPVFAFQGSFPVNRKSSRRAEAPIPTPRQLPSVAASSSPKSSQVHGYSHAASTRSRRSSQQKIYQLTGMDVDVMDDQSFPSGGADSDSSSTGSGVKLDEPATYEVPEYYLVPVLEADVDGSSSRGSSWGPMSPELAVMPPPLNLYKQPMRDDNEKQPGGLNASFTQMHLEDGIIRPWDPAYGQFSDHRAAGEYHQFTAQLANMNSVQFGDNSLQPSTPQKKKRSSLSFAFSAASRFRRRETPQPIDTAATTIQPRSLLHPSYQPKQQQQSTLQSHSPSSDGSSRMALPPLSCSAPSTPILALASAPPPRPSPAPPLVSAWDTDSDDDDGHVMSNLKDWFASRTHEDGKLHRRTSSASRVGSDRQSTDLKQDQMGQSITRPADRHKQIQMEKAAKRREQMKPQMKVVPEGIILHNVHL